MARYKVGDTVVLDGRKARVVWLSENASEIEAMDEYIVEFDDKRREFIISSALHESPAVNNRHGDSDPRQRQTY